MRFTRMRNKNPTNPNPNPNPIPIPPSPTRNDQPPGCVWGLLHIIKYHHWHYVKKRLVHKRHRGTRSPTGVGNPGNQASYFNAGVQEDSSVKSKESNAEGKMRQFIPTGINSVKAKIKARISAEISWKKGRHNRSSSCPVRTSQLKRTESLHHLEPPAHLDPLAEMVLNEGSPRTVHQNSEKSCATSKPPIPPMDTHEKVNENLKGLRLHQENVDNDAMQDMFDQKLIHVKEFDADASVNHPKEYLEALDIINVNKELLVKMLHDPGSPLAQHFQNQQAVSAKMGLTKSVTFPLQRGSEPVKPRTKHELSKSKHASKSPKLAGSSSLKYSGEGSMPPIAEYNADGILNLNQVIADNGGEDKVVIKRFKDMRQKIRHVIRESRKERHMITMDSILHKIPRGQKLMKEMEKEIANHSKDPAMGKESPGSTCESDHSSVSPVKNKQMHHMRRASSLNESLDSYCHLYETSYNKEPKCHTSERLKLRTQRAGSPLHSVPKNLGRIFSLPELKSYNYQNDADAFPSEAPVRTFGDSRRNSFDDQNSIELDYTVSNNETNARVDEVADDNEKLKAGKIEAIISRAEPFPISVPDFNASMSEGAELELKPRDRTDTEKMVVASPSKLSYDVMTHLRVGSRDVAEFNYVRDVLEQSGFSGNESLGSWHSDHPVDLLMYGDGEGCLVHDPDCSGNEEGGKCEHFLLFDLINEVLMEVYGRSYNYCPVALSSLCHIPLMPAGHHVLKEVWALVSWYLSLRLEVDQSLDYVVSRDLAKKDGWMNLQFDSECIGIELEDLIFDELLEEVSLSLWMEMDQVSSEGTFNLLTHYCFSNLYCYSTLHEESREKD